MEDKIRTYVDDLFAETVKTKKAVELKEEMILNLHDKYNDLISEGKTHEAAYNIAVAGIGDISGLLSELEADELTEAPYIYESEAARHKSAMLTAIAVMMYILSFLPMFVLSVVGSRFTDTIGGPAAFVMIAAATGLLVYNSMSKPRNYKGSGTMVDDFRVWQTDTQNHKSMRRAISAALWSILLALYFIISFWTFAWHITWIIFLIGLVVESLLNIFFVIKKGGDK